VAEAAPPAAAGGKEEEEGRAAPVGFDPPPFTEYARRGFSLRDYVKEVVRTMVRERGRATLNDVWAALRRAAEMDKRVAEGLTPRLVLSVLRELKKEGYDIRLKLG
jgi:hypothetical protein